MKYTYVLKYTICIYSVFGTVKLVYKKIRILYNKKNDVVVVKFFLLPQPFL